MEEKFLMDLIGCYREYFPENTPDSNRSGPLKIFLPSLITSWLFFCYIKKSYHKKFH